MYVLHYMFHFSPGRKSNIHNLKATRIKTQLEIHRSNLVGVTDVHQLH